MIRVEEVGVDWRSEYPVFASEGFLRCVSSKYGWLAGVNDRGQRICILPYTVFKKPGFFGIRFRVQTIAVEPLSIEAEAEFLAGVIEFFRAKGADMIIPPSTNAVFRTYPAGADAAPYGTFVNDLTLPEETLFGGLNSSHRRKVRLALKEGVTIKTGPEFAPEAYRLVRDTFARSSLPFMAQGEFEALVSGLRGNVRVFVAEKDNQVQGAMVVPFSAYAAYYVYGGSIPEPAPGAMNLMHWEAMRQFKSEGVQRYDFVGARINPDKDSKQEGLLQFKQRFGGQLVQGYLWKFTFNRAKGLLYKLAVRVQRGGDIVDQEAHKLNTDANDE